MENTSLLKLIFSKHFAKMLGISIGIIILSIIAVLLMLRIYTDHGEANAVPDFTGYTQEDLAKTVKERHLRYRIIDSLYVNDLPGGVVLAQYPEAGFKVKKDRMIFITLNAFGREKVIMPNVIGVSYRQARAIIENRGLVPGKLKYVPDIAFNNVLEQEINNEPALPGDTVFKNTVIDLVLGSGLSDTTTVVPNLIGLSLEDAKNKLAEYSLNIGGELYDKGVQEINDSLVPFIWKQKPGLDSGVKLKLGGMVDVWFTLDSTKLPGYDTTFIEEENDENLLQYFD